MAALDEQTAGDDPLAFFHKWFAEAQHAKITEVNAMTLATVNAAGQPHARIVLLKGVEDGGFVFFTNYSSTKGHDLEVNPHASLLFFWKELERQVCIEGRVIKTSDEESNAYYQSRPAGSRIGAWASPQSEVIADRGQIENNFKEYEAKFGEAVIPRPPHWGGYILKPVSIEFWQGRSSRLHDRIQYRLLSDSSWKIQRLAP